MARGDGRIYRKLKDFLSLLSNDSPLVNHVVSMRYASRRRLWSTRNCVKDRQLLSVITWRHNVQQKSYWTRRKKSIKSVPIHSSSVPSNRNVTPNGISGKSGLLLPVLEERLDGSRRLCSKKYLDLKRIEQTHLA